MMSISGLLFVDCSHPSHSCKLVNSWSMFLEQSRVSYEKKPHLSRWIFKCAENEITSRHRQITDIRAIVDDYVQSPYKIWTNVNLKLLVCIWTNRFACNRYPQPQINHSLVSRDQWVYIWSDIENSEQTEHTDVVNCIRIDWPTRENRSILKTIFK